MKAEGSSGPEQAVIRIGHFQFLNGYPLYYGLEKGAGWGCFHLVNGVPTVLNHMLLQGELDISPISSIECAAHAGELLFLPRVSITADGAVDSIRLISSRPIDEVRTVAVTQQSATSVVLLKILLKQRYGLDAAYGALDGGIDEALGSHDAVLLIGDQALGAHYGAIEEYSYDLGEEWKGFTGLPMVFALWAVRRPFFARRAEETMEVQDRLCQSVEYCRGHWDEVVAAAACVYPFDEELLFSYFDKLRYDFSDEYREGLTEFYRRAVEIGEAAPTPELEFVEA
ncbi:MAG TPA: hypothetical protein ENH54_01300 [Actinobacteria bacterium]|nr:hypothetical protein [Actinomycetota bacterium]